MGYFRVEGPLSPPAKPFPPRNPDHRPWKPSHARSKRDEKAETVGPAPEAVLAATRARLASMDPAAAAGISAVFRVDLSGHGGGCLFIVAEGGRLRLLEDAPAKTDLCLSLSAEAYRKLLAGRFNAVGAYMTKRLKVVGDIGLALKLQALFK